LQGAEQARPKPSPTGVAFLDVERTGPELENLLENLNRPSETLGSWKRSVELDPSVEWFSREVDSGKIIAGRDLKVRERLVVLQVLIVLGLNIFDEPGFEK
jgi:hypothetical protein